MRRSAFCVMLAALRSRLATETGRIGKLHGVSAKAAYSKAD